MIVGVWWLEDGSERMAVGGWWLEGGHRRMLHEGG